MPTLIDVWSSFDRGWGELVGLLFALLGPV